MPSSTGPRALAILRLLRQHPIVGTPRGDPRNPVAPGQGLLAQHVDEHVVFMQDGSEGQSVLSASRPTRPPFQPAKRDEEGPWPSPRQRTRPPPRRSYSSRPSSS